MDDDYRLPPRGGPDARAARELEEQRRKHEQLQAMMDEVGSEDSSDDDAPLRPMRRGTRTSGTAARAHGPSLGARPGGDSDDSDGSGGARKSTSGAGAGAGGGKREEVMMVKESSSDSDDEATRARHMSEFSAASAAAPDGAATGGGASSEGKDGDKTMAVNAATLRPWMVKPVRPGERAAECFVERDRGGLRSMKPVFSVFVEGENRFICAGQKRLSSRTSNFLIAMDPNPGDRKSDLVLGKLRSNWAGSGYTLFDHGMSPENAVTDSALRRELMVIFFDYDKMGPGRLAVAVPRVNDAGTAVVFRPREREDGIEEAARKRDTERLMFLENKRPKWDEAVGGHVLNFHGRVTKSSVKNFQLSCDDTGDNTVLQFGRVGKNKFTMDFQYPLSPLQAFAICLASMDGKLADTKGFERFKGISEKAEGIKNFFGRRGSKK